MINDIALQNTFIVDSIKSTSFQDGEIVIDISTNSMYIANNNELIQIKESQLSSKETRSLTDKLNYEECLLDIENIYIDLLRQNPNLNFTEQQFNELEMLKKIIPKKDDIIWEETIFLTDKKLNF